VVPEPSAPRPQRRIQAVVFDAVGTLLHLREPVGETYARRAAQAGVTLPASRLEEAFGRVLAAAPPAVHPGTPLAGAASLERAWWRERVRETFRAADGVARFTDFDAFFEGLWEYYAGAAAWSVARGARPALRQLRAAGLRLAVLSNFDQRLRGLLRALELHAFFDTVTLPSDAGAAKPDRAIFDVCLKRLGLAGHRAVYVGDRAEEDLRGARAAGMAAIDVKELATLEDVPARIEALEKAAALVPGETPRGRRRSAADGRSPA